jgi:hypothetical protein
MSTTPAAVRPAAGPEVATLIAYDSRSLDEYRDHAKYVAVSHESFAMPQNGSLQFSVAIQASPRVTKPEERSAGPTPIIPTTAEPTRRPRPRASQPALRFNVTNVETGQVFDWFVSGSSVAALIERLPSSVSNPSLSARDPGYVGVDRAYTQIIRAAAVNPGETNDLATRYTRNAVISRVLP